MIYIKMHLSENGTLIAMCDESLLGKVLAGGDIEMDLKTYSEFYKGDLVGKEDAKKEIERVDDIYSVNVVGKESIEVAIEEKLIQKNNVKKVQKVPYAHAYNVNI